MADAWPDRVGNHQGKLCVTWPKGLLFRDGEVHSCQRQVSEGSAGVVVKGLDPGCFRMPLAATQFSFEPAGRESCRNDVVARQPSVTLGHLFWANGPDPGTRFQVIVNSDSPRFGGESGAKTMLPQTHSYILPI
jgi:hypothetical protein